MAVEGGRAVDCRGVGAALRRLMNVIDHDPCRPFVREDVGGRFQPHEFLAVRPDY